MSEISFSQIGRGISDSIRKLVDHAWMHDHRIRYISLITQDACRIWFVFGR